MVEQVDTLILGAGAAGLFCGARTGARGRRTLVLDHSAKPAEKVRISGGGRCNFTNLETVPHAFISNNPHFAKSALARYTPWDFCDLMSRHDLSWHEKTLGQLFCDQKSSAVIKLLLDELDIAGSELRLSTGIGDIQHTGEQFLVATSDGDITARSLVIATGGLSIPKIGASALAYTLAAQFGHTVIEPKPALVPLTFTGQASDDFASISGVSIGVEARANSGPSFAENLLFTHRGLSGPAILQVSSYWKESEPVQLDLLPGIDGPLFVDALKASHPRLSLPAALATHFPKRFADMLAAQIDQSSGKRLAEWSRQHLNQLAQALKAWAVKPVGSEGWRTAEVTRGGIDTEGLSSRTMESKHVPGLYFIGECVDVTGWLGGYNFQWAWASAAAAGEVA